MSLKCSVLGHSYGETTVERDREEQGSEVVITIREVETCGRCGTERVVSENKEVTSIETPDDELDVDAAGDEDADTPVAGETDAAGASADSSDEVAADDDATDGDEADDAPAAGEELSASEIVGEDEADTPAAPEGSEPDTGAEIIDAESDEPVDDAEAVDEELADPTVDPDVDGTATAEPSGDDAGDGDADDAVIIDEEDGADADEPAGRQPGEWPEEPDKGDDEWKPDTIGTIGEDEDEEEQATESKTLTVPDGQFRCPECGFTTLVEASSLRRGDFCPDCRRGSLVHEPEDETRKE